MEDYQDLEFEIGNYTVTVDILDIDGNDVDYRITDMREEDSIQYYDLDYEQLVEEIMDYCIEEGLI